MRGVLDSRVGPAYLEIKKELPAISITITVRSLMSMILNRSAIQPVVARDGIIATAKHATLIHLQLHRQPKVHQHQEGYLFTLDHYEWPYHMAHMIYETYNIKQANTALNPY